MNHTKLLIVALNFDLVFEQHSFAETDSIFS